MARGENKEDANLSLKTGKTSTTLAARAYWWLKACRKTRFMNDSTMAQLSQAPIASSYLGEGGERRKG